MSIERNAQQSRERLEAYRRQIQQRMIALREEMDHLKAELAWIEDRSELLGRLAHDQSVQRGAIVLQGAELREQAAILLGTRFGPDRGVHYRDWYGELLQAGFVVLGKRPAAAFLTAATRSPLVIRDADAGFYRFNPDGRQGLVAEADQLQVELAAVDGHVEHEHEQHLSPVMRKHRTALLASKRRVDRQIAEVDRILEAYRLPTNSSRAA